MSTDLPAIGISMFSTDRCIHPTELATESKHGASHRFICPNTATFRPRGPRPGTSVTLVAQHDPIWLAKQFATLDHLNGGRVVMGVGFGWNVTQAEHHGLDFRRRRQRSTSKRCARCGPHTRQPTRAGVQLKPSWAYPKPSRSRGLPIVMGGGHGPVLFDAIARYADGWMPITGRTSIADRLAPLQARFEAAGRDPGCTTDPDGLINLGREGVGRVLLTIWREDRDEILRNLDAFEHIKDAVYGSR